MKNTDKATKRIADRIRKMSDSELVWSHRDCSLALEGLLTVTATNSWVQRMGGERYLTELSLFQKERARRGI